MFHFHQTLSAAGACAPGGAQKHGALQGDEVQIGPAARLAEDDEAHLHLAGLERDERGVFFVFSIRLESGND